MKELLALSGIKMDLRNCDCMDLMKEFPDKYFDLAIVDPPYGILNKTKRGGDYKFNMKEYSKWDIKPDNDYFDELFRVSKNQIIWGGNYFGQLWARSQYNKGFIIWDKNQPETLNNFAMAEMAWSSLDRPSKIFRYSVRKNRNKIHPTQKPTELYEWILKMYANPEDKILDTHLGSMSSVIACYDEKFDITGSELDPDYFKAGIERVAKHTSDMIICKDEFEAERSLYQEYMRAIYEVENQYHRAVDKIRRVK